MQIFVDFQKVKLLEEHLEREEEVACRIEWLVREKYRVSQMNALNDTDFLYEQLQAIKEEIEFIKEKRKCISNTKTKLTYAIESFKEKKGQAVHTLRDIG